MTLILNQPIPPRKRFNDCEKLAIQLVIINSINKETGLGDCIEVDFNPEDCRRYVEQRSNYKLTIRQVGKNKWRIWKETR